MKTKMKYSKRILGLFILVALCLMKNVLAAEVTRDQVLCQKIKDDISSAYGLKLDYNLNATEKGKNPQITISMNIPQTTLSSITGMSRNSITFRVKEIIISDIPKPTNNIEVTYKMFKENPNLLSNYHVYSGSALQTRFGSNYYDLVLGDKGSFTINDTQTSASRYYIVLESYENDLVLKDKCGIDAYSNPVFVLDVPGTKPVIKYDTIPDAPVVPPVVTTGMIDCDKMSSFAENSFEYSYCRDRKAALDSGVKITKYSQTYSTYSELIKHDSSQKISDFTCDPFKFDNGVGEKYYTNTSYLLGSMDITLSAGQYIYHHGGQNSETGESYYTENVDKEDITCKVTCNEVVSVEYGSPVASKAGLCFEYKVKVTSRVNCVADNPNPPKRDNSYCEPVPICQHCGQDDRSHGAGPGEEFDACIDSCDGGKYTASCSKSCYNKVYGNDNPSKTGIMIQYDDVAMKMANADEKFFTVKGKTIEWHGGGLGRWYWAQWGDAYKNWTGCNYGGAYAVCGCCASCWWEGCSKNQYLNPGEAAKDVVKNDERYVEAAKICSSYSKCSTSQAEFTISADYSHDGGKKETIYYPYTANNDKTTKDTIKYTSGSNVICTNENTNSTIISFDGCYKCGGNNVDGTPSSTRYYMTEWGFPGTWISKKNGQISFKPMSGWLKVEGKFCIPSGAEDVNQGWWNANFFNDIEKNKTIYSINDTDLSEKRGSNITFSACKAPEIKKDKIDYNIRAAAKTFGLFGWDINIKCFYALNSNFPEYEDGDSCLANSSKSNVEDGYSIRSVDLVNLFPNENGDSLTSFDTTGRAAGFNWTSYATNDKIEEYLSDPKAYRTWIQKMGYDVYSDEYLDYDVTLTKEMIKTLKNEHKSKKAFNTNELEPISDVVVNYRSSLFRGSNPLLKEFKVPSEKALRCNNMKNYQSDDCFVGEGK